MTEIQIRSNNKKYIPVKVIRGIPDIIEERRLSKSSRSSLEVPFDAENRSKEPIGENQKNPLPHSVPLLNS